MTNKTYRLWKPIQFTHNWQECDTSILDDISASWFKRRTVLKESTSEYSDFLERLKREHAIETGVIERLYDLKQGITEIFIKEGFVKSYLSHGDTDISKTDLMNHLNDHLDAVNFIFDVVKENRPLTTGFVKELHHLVTRHQKHAAGRDQFGNKLQIFLLKGIYKVRENNPTRGDGTIIMYCPPEQVASEMDNLVGIYNDLVEKGEHPLVISAWFHHAFTTIHPFQDGNGRVARLLASLIFIRYGFFPFTVLRAEAKVKYIEALGKADKENPCPIVQYFGEVQKRNIHKSLNIKTIANISLSEVQKILTQKIENLQYEKEDYQKLIAANKTSIFEYSLEEIKRLKENLELNLNDGTTIEITVSPFEKSKNQNYYYTHTVSYAQKNDYYFNRTLPKAWIACEISLSNRKDYQMGISFHHYGYGYSTLAIAVFLEYEKDNGILDLDISLPIELPPHVFSIEGDVEVKKTNIQKYLENALAVVLTQIVNDLG